MSTSRIVIVLAAATLAGTSSAGPLRPGHVDPDATWIAHLDVERFTRSTFGRFVLEHEGELDLELDQVRDDLGIDPVRDLYGVTLYGEDDPEEEAIAVIEMSRGVDRILERLEEEPSYRRLEVDDYVVHRWNDGEPTYGVVLHGRNADRRLVVLAGAADTVVDAAQIVDGRRPSLADAIEDDDARIDAGALPDRGSIAFALAHGLPWMEHGDDPASAIARRSDRVRFELRERNDLTTAELVIAARSNDDAANITDVLRGLVALGEMLASSEPELGGFAEVLDGLSIRGVDNDVRVRLRADVDELRRWLGVAMEMD